MQDGKQEGVGGGCRLPLRVEDGRCGLPIEAYTLDPTPACYFYDRKEGNIADIEEWKKPRPFSEEEVFSTLPPPATCHVCPRMRRRHAGLICECDGDTLA